MGWTFHCFVAKTGSPRCTITDLQA